MKTKTLQTAIVKGALPRSFDFTISTGEVDREHDRIDPAGWVLDAYKKNPVTLFAHDAYAPPIAKSVAIGVVGGALGSFRGALRSTTVFPPIGVYPFADTIHDLIAEGFLAATSVGFLPLAPPTRNEFSGYDYSSVELLEFSIVPVPALPTALIDGRAARINTPALTKWLRTGAALAGRVAAGSGVVRSVKNITTSLEGQGIRDPQKYLRDLARHGHEKIALRLRESERLPVGPYELGEMIGQAVAEQVERALFLATGNLNHLPKQFRR